MTNGIINNNTKVSIALVIAIVVPVIGFVVTFTTIKAKQSAIDEKVTAIEKDYVPRNEIEIQLKAINEKLDILTKQNGK